MAQPSTAGATQSSQLWVGNIPPGLTEKEVLFQMAAYGLRPWKCVYRMRDRFAEGFAICYFATPALATQALASECRWSSGKHMLFR